MTDDRLKVLFAIPLLLFALSFIAVDFIPYRSALTGDELQVVNFAPEDLSPPPVKRTKPGGDFSKPMELCAAQETLPQQSAERSDAVHARKVTMIVRGDRGSMVMIDGVLVREGERVGSLIVKKIEAGRVLVQPDVRSGGQSPVALQQWLPLEDMP